MYLSDLDGGSDKMRSGADIVLSVVEKGRWMSVRQTSLHDEALAGSWTAMKIAEAIFWITRK